jgi:hypothetical protein
MPRIKLLLLDGNEKYLCMYFKYFFASVIVIFSTGFEWDASYLRPSSLKETQLGCLTLKL